jgi:hypothetical protein
LATVPFDIPIESAIPATTNGAQHKIVDGTNFPVHSLAFDGGSVDETVFFQLGMLPNYGAGNLTLAIHWYADTATSGNVVWGAAIAVITPNTDTQDVETKAFATANTQQDSHLGTTGQRLHTIDLVISNLDALAAGDAVWLKLYRDASDTTNDTMAGDALVTGLRLSYSDT